MKMKLKALCISLSCVFFISFFVATGNSDTLLLVKKADSLYAHALFYEAGNYYQKAAYYSVSPNNKTNCILRKIDCLKQRGAFGEVDNIVSTMRTDNLNDSLLHQLLGQAALCSYLSNDFKKAESYLIMLEYNLSNKASLSDKSLLYSLILNEQQRWDEAKLKVVDYINYTVTDSVLKTAFFRQTDSLYSKNNYPKLKKPERAQLLSHVFPGLGQIYAGFPAEGLSSFALIVSSLALTGTAIYSHYYVSGIIAGDFLFGKLYIGGGKRADFLARKKNYQRVNKYNASIKKISLQYLK